MLHIKFRLLMQGSRTCYIDCTETFNSGLNTGIQRVVRNIQERAERFSSGAGLQFVPIITIGARSYYYNSNFICTRITNRLLGRIRNTLDTTFAISDSDINELGNARLKELNKTEDGNIGIKLKCYEPILKACRNFIPVILKIPQFVDSIICSNKLIEYGQGDVLLLADACWNINSYLAAKKARQEGAKVILLIHDIIPLTHPELASNSTRYNFIEYFPKILRIADGIIANSKFTMIEVNNFCKRYDFPANIQYDYFSLGADFKAAGGSNQIRKQLITELRDGNYYLMVGTIEPRKNHLFILDTFEYLWEQGKDTKLCIIGRTGWKCEQILRRITESKYYNKNLLLFNQINDSELEYSYKNTKAVIIASQVEGFGLPVIEAMHNNKIVLASDIPVFREVGGEYPIYFSLTDKRSLIDCIYRVETGDLKSSNENHEWLSWDESIASLFEKVGKMAETFL